MTKSTQQISLSQSEAKAVYDALASSGHEHLAKLVGPCRQSSEEERNYARIAKEVSDDDFEIDDDPVVSVGIGGAFVSAWIWIPAPEVEAVD